LSALPEGQAQAYIGDEALGRCQRLSSRHAPQQGANLAEVGKRRPAARALGQMRVYQPELLAVQLAIEAGPKPGRDVFFRHLASRR
jgi:hypothetical protein